MRASHLNPSPLLPLTLLSPPSSPQYLLGVNGLYHRLDPQLPRQIALDDVTAMPELRAFADSIDLDATLTFIEKNFMDEYAQSEHEGGTGEASSDDYNAAWAQHTASAGSSEGQASKHAAQA